VPECFQIRAAERVNKIRDECVLRLLRQRDAQQFELFGNRPLTDVVYETEVASETNVEIFRSEAIKSAIVQSLHA
jgi:hypothetical protein